MAGGVMPAWSALMACTGMYDLVVQYRACPQAAAMEREFLDHCIEEGNKKQEGRRSDEGTAIEGSASILQPRFLGGRGI